MTKPYNIPCEICGSTNQILFDDEDRKSIFCKSCKNYKDIYASDELKQYWEKQEQQKIKEELNSKSSKLIVTCPYCQSTNTSKITLTKRAVKVGLFGIFGVIDDAGKTYKCNGCGCKF